MVCADADKIITIMSESCMTPKEIAEKAGVSVTAVYRVRNGYMVRMDIFGKVCKVLEVKCEDVIDYEKLKRWRERKR